MYNQTMLSYLAWKCKKQEGYVIELKAVCCFYSMMVDLWFGFAHVFVYLVAFPNFFHYFYLVARQIIWIDVPGGKQR